MSTLDVLIGIAGLLATAAVVAGMILLTPRGTSEVQTTHSDDLRAMGSELSPRPVRR